MKDETQKSWKKEAYTSLLLLLILGGLIFMLFAIDGLQFRLIR